MPQDIEEIKKQALRDYAKKDYSTALTGFQECLVLYEESGDELAVAEMRNNICVAHIGLKDGEKAYQAVLGTNEIFARAGDRKRQGMALANTATALELLGRQEEALTLYEQVLEIFKDAGEKEMRVSILRRVSDLQFKTRRRLQSIASMEAAYDQTAQGSVKDSIFKTLLTSLRRKFIK